MEWTWSPFAQQATKADALVDNLQAAGLPEDGASKPSLSA
jgi:hypothetical protein